MRHPETQVWIQGGREPASTARQQVTADSSLASVSRFPRTIIAECDPIVDGCSPVCLVIANWWSRELDWIMTKVKSPAECSSVSGSSAGWVVDDVMNRNLFRKTVSGKHFPDRQWKKMKDSLKLDRSQLSWKNSGSLEKIQNDLFELHKSCQFRERSATKKQFEARSVRPFAAESDIRVTGGEIALVDEPFDCFLDWGR
jgi:hypothetical protein